MSAAVEILSTEDRALLDSVLDVLIPGGSGMPSAREVATGARWLPAALELRPDLHGQLAQVLSTVAGHIAGGIDVATALRRTAADEPEDFGAVAGLLAGAYYLDPEVRASLGYPGQEDRQLDDDTSDYFDLLERVVDRGPIYRDPATGN